LGGTFHAGSLHGYGGEGFNAERLKRYVRVTAIVATIPMRGSVPPDGRFVRQMRVREGIADEGTGSLRDKQTLVLVQRMFQPTQYGRNLTSSCQNRAGLFTLSAHGKPETLALNDDFAPAVERPHA
jgi:hypothetical protein